MPLTFPFKHRCFAQPAGTGWRGPRVIFLLNLVADRPLPWSTNSDRILSLRNCAKSSHNTPPPRDERSGDKARDCDLGSLRGPSDTGGRVDYRPRYALGEQVQFALIVVALIVAAPGASLARAMWESGCAMYVDSGKTEHESGTYHETAGLLDLALRYHVAELLIPLPHESEVNPPVLIYLGAPPLLLSSSGMELLSHALQLSVPRSGHNLLLVDCVFDLAIVFFLPEEIDRSLPASLDLGQMGHAAKSSPFRPLMHSSLDEGIEQA